uniref:Phytanoyl-CoA dioxygenase n=1 Tax=Phaeomonas parva TaxID=124430 RepID=A0A7S1U125_9STRA|mmetsp:Transcript_26759/g.83822  ORF Transcript_26759/g.83822 Transcript_26759/m.83822 type:complete len:243 (+) Transcript_26759:629-1357(+)
MGCERARLYQDQTFFKGRRDGKSPAHQDMFAAPFDWSWDASDAGRTLGAWVPLTPTGLSTGSLGYVPGSHKGGLIGYGYNFERGSLEGFKEHLEDPEKRARMAEMAVAAGMAHPDEWEITSKIGDYQEGTFVVPATEVRPGDVIFHDGWTVHGAKNQTPAPGEEVRSAREALAVQFVAEGITRGPNPTPRGLYHMDSNSVSRWADDFDHGQVVLTDWMPVVYDAAEAAAPPLTPSAALADEL